MAPGQLARYVGSYGGPGLQHELLVRADTLFYRLPENAATVPLHPFAPHVFIGHDACLDLLFRITFDAEEDGTINGYRAEVEDGWTGAFRRLAEAPAGRGGQ
ncbi:MAG TPA: hypothetical protein ENO23_09150 [Alphaproteobacteria bacterium]|nr:hypothetical protein [Alphaproteobacteria bacterium]